MPIRHAAVTLQCFAFLSVALAGQNSPDSRRPQEILDHFSQQGLAEYTRGSYRNAAETFLAGHKAAQRVGELHRAARFLNAAGGARLAMLDQRGAQELLWQAMKSARSAGDLNTAAAAAVNLTSVYLQACDVEAARAMATDALTWIPAFVAQRSALLAQLAMLDQAAGKDDEALKGWAAAADQADRAWDDSLLAWSWLQRGLIHMAQGNYERAENLLTASFRLYLLTRDPTLAHAYRALALLRMRQGRPQEALTLIKAAVAAHRARPSPGLGWDLYADQARVLAAANRRGEALEQGRLALRMAARDRLAALPNHWSGIGLDVQNSRAVRQVMQLLLAEAPGADQAREALGALEQWRGAGLRALQLPSALVPGGEAGIWLARFREAQTRAVRTGKLVDTAELAVMRGQHSLHPAPAAAGPGPDPVLGLAPADAVRRLQDGLGPNEALLSFFVDDTRSWRFELTRSGLAWNALLGRERLHQVLAAYRAAVASNDPAWRERAAVAGEALFGKLTAAARSRTQWRLSFDDPGLAIPFAALPGVDDPSKRLVEEHGLEWSLSGFAVDSPQSQRGQKAWFVGDAVYNRADPRASHPPARQRAGFTLLPAVWAADHGDAGIELPRLAGSAWETRQLAELWRRRGFEVGSFVGANATHVPEGLNRGAPRLLHLATHVLPVAGNRLRAEGADLPSGAWSPRSAEDIWIALGYSDGGVPRYLTPAEITTFRLPGTLVVMNGCASGAGPVLAGAGLLGLSRAWLAAGAGAVVATLWPVDDGRSRFMEVLYAALPARPDGMAEGAAAALRAAQVKALREPGGLARPAVWAQYFVVGKE